MFRIDRRNNITISTGDNAILDISLCGECLSEGDKVIFTTPESNIIITEFYDGIAKAQINKSNTAIEGNYCIRAIMKDGRDCLIAEGKYIRKGGC